MRWIRLWTDETINGTTFTELTAEQRGVWWSLLILAGYSPVPGVICIAPGIPYTRGQMAGFLKLPLDVLTRSIEHLASPEVKKIVINQDGTIAIANWNKYQTEYDRQKGYRRGLQGKVTKKGYTSELQTDVEEEVDVDKEKDKEKPNTTVPQAGPPDVDVVFKHWQKTLNHPQAKLTPERQRKIKIALKTYSAAQLCTAIEGCAKTPHNMGQNDRHEVYDDLCLILRDAAHIERFMRNAESPPKSPAKSANGFGRSHDDGIVADGKRLGILPKVGESMDDYRLRVQQRLGR